jgi:transcriptional regulator with PAS, ATPase and Fis domain
VKNTLFVYDFPGNIRELESLIKRLVAMTEEEVIKVHYLPDNFLSGMDKQAVTFEGDTGGLEEVKEMERQMVQEAVEKYGSQHKAALALGLSQSTVSRKLKRM